MSRWGQDVVEEFIDTCLSLENLIDPMSAYIVRQRPPRTPEQQRADEEAEPEVGKLRSKGYMDSFINPPEYLEAQKKKKEEEAKKQRRRFPEQPQRDVLQFLIENAPLESWERDGGYPVQYIPTVSRASAPENASWGGRSGRRPR